MSLARRLATGMVAAAARLLPARLSPWAGAMANELIEIRDDRSALLFAAGCLRAAASLAIMALARSAFAAIRSLLFPAAPIQWSFPTMNRISDQPRLIGLICGAFAVGMGLAYMEAAGAPFRYLLVNFFALVLGATAWLALGRARRSDLPGAGLAILALSVPLLLTALFGVSADGATRWVRFGPLSLQVSLIVLPAMIIAYARKPDWAGTAGMVVAAFALALQPDRAMAAVLAAGLLALLLAAPGRRPVLAASAAAILAFGWTLLAPDPLPASEFVDQVLYTAFDVHPMAGAAVLIGSAALIAPAAASLRKGHGDRAVLLAFGAFWSTVLAAAALGNYPTPLVGYGGSAVLGYLLSVALLPDRPFGTASRGDSESPPTAGRDSDEAISKLCAPNPA